MPRIEKSFSFGAASSDGGNILSWSLFRDISKKEKLEDVESATREFCNGCRVKNKCRPTINAGPVKMWSGEQVLRVNVDGKQDTSNRNKNELGVGCGGKGCGLVE